VQLRERDIGEKEIRERDIWERDIGETVATCRFAEQLLLDIGIRRVSVCHSFSQRWRPRARFWRHHNPQKLESADGVCPRSWWS
jgi:hypothetical protein